MGFVDIDGKRYFDVREQIAQPVLPNKPDSTDPKDGSKIYCLESDSRQRIDSQQLQQGDVVQAQTNKETLEKLQRHDRALREAAKKRREKKDGAKIVFDYRKEKK